MTVIDERGGQREEGTCLTTSRRVRVSKCIDAQSESHLEAHPPPTTAAAKPNRHDQVWFLMKDQNKCNLSSHCAARTVHRWRMSRGKGQRLCNNPLSFCSCAQCLYIWQQGIRKVPALGLQLKLLLIHNNGFVRGGRTFVCALSQITWQATRHIHAYMHMSSPIFSSSAYLYTLPEVSRKQYLSVSGEGIEALFVFFNQVSVV